MQAALFSYRFSVPARLQSSAPWTRRLQCSAMASQEETREKEGQTNQPHPNIQPENPSNQQPLEAGDEGAKSSKDGMFLAYGDSYATRAGGDDAYGERYGSPDVNPFDKDVKGDKAVELGIPELKNRDKVHTEVVS